jgi:hypothetical protein
MMIDVIATMIDGVGVPAARPRLRKCLPPLAEAVENIDARATRGRLLIAAATPEGAMVMAADGWPQIDRSKLTRGDAARAVVTAIEMGEGDAIITSLTILLGRAGSTGARRRADHGGRRPAAGGRPDQREQNDVTLLITTVAIPTATVH